MVVVATGGDQGAKEAKFDFLALVELLGGGGIEAEQAGGVQPTVDVPPRRRSSPTWRRRAWSSPTPLASSR